MFDSDCDVVSESSEELDDVDDDSDDDDGVDGDGGSDGNEGRGDGGSDERVHVVASSTSTSGSLPSSTYKSSGFTALAMALRAACKSPVMAAARPW